MSRQLDTDARIVYWRLIAYARPYWSVFLVGVLGMALFAATDSGLVWLVYKFLRGTFVQRNPEILWYVPWGVVVLFALRGIGDFVANYFPGWVGRQVVKTLRGEVFAHYLHLPVAFIEREQSGHLLSRLTYNIELVAEAATTASISIIRDTLTIVGLLAMIFYQNWRLSVYSLAVAPLVAWLMQIANRLFRRYSARIQSSMGDVTRVAKESIDAHRLIKIFNAEAQQSERFEAVNETNRASNMKLVRTKAVSNPVVQGIAALGLASVLYVAIRQVFSHAMRVDEFMAFLTGLFMITAPLRRLVNVSGPLQQGVAAGQSVFELLDAPPEDTGGTVPLSRARGSIEFKNVSFEYRADKGPVLRDVSFSVAAGETVAIVGRSGSGKTSLVGLLPRFYDVTAGSVLLDGRDVRDYPLARLRDQFAFVSQDTVLFNDTLRSNICFNARNKDDADVMAAARAANLEEFIGEQPQGLASPLADRGQNVSGGQRQRISIARALLKDAPILILDEATASLDTESERRIQQALAQLMRGRTTLVIAHRLSTIESAERIVVLEQGCIAEMGTHRELLAHGGVYAALHRMQFNA